LPGTPAPPQVAALLKFPDRVEVYAAIIDSCFYTSIRPILELPMLVVAHLCGERV
jgi:hypothetical protein